MTEALEKTENTEAKAAPQSAVNIDASAVERINWLREREGLGADTKLRIAVVGGGCSGFKYAMGLTDESFEDDIVFEDAVIIDEATLDIMKGSTVSYVDHLTGAKFVIDNPNVETGCGCGSSFTVKE